MYFSHNSCLPLRECVNTGWGWAGARFPPSQRAVVPLHLLQHLLAMAICLHPSAPLLWMCVLSPLPGLPLTEDTLSQTNFQNYMMHLLIDIYSF